jgi:hypothetical protein
MPTQLTEHFTIEELGLQNATPQQLQNARFLCSEVMEPIHLYFNAAINVHCSLRNADHNNAVGGVKASYHLYNEGKAAIDFDVHGFTYVEVFDWIRLKSGLPVDKVILERNAKEIPVTIHIQTDLFTKNRQEAYEGYTGIVEKGLAKKVYKPVPFIKGAIKV